MPDFDVLKPIEGVIFQGCIIYTKLLSDLDLGGPGDLKSDLRGQMRSRQKFNFPQIFKFHPSEMAFLDPLNC